MFFLTHHPVEERHPLLFRGLLYRVDEGHGDLELRCQGRELRAHRVAFHHLAAEAEAAGLDKTKTSTQTITKEEKSCSKDKGQLSRVTSKR